LAASRKKIPPNIVQEVLTESGYRCAVPTCRNILAIDLHHMVEVSEGGGNELSNLVALCPTCHALFHRGTITRDSIYAWKGVLVSLSHAFDQSAIDDLLFLSKLHPKELAISGDGVLKFSRLIAADLAAFKLLMQNGPMVLYEVGVTQKGEALVNAWKAGDREGVKSALGVTEQ
jgi:hypothetical protein